MSVIVMAALNASLSSSFLKPSSESSSGFKGIASHLVRAVITDQSILINLSISWCQNQIFFFFSICGQFSLPPHS